MLAGVFHQSGQDNAQIVILDMARRQLGFLTLGQGPVAVMQPI